MALWILLFEVPWREMKGLPRISLWDDGVVLVLPLPGCCEQRSVFQSYSVTALPSCAIGTLKSPWHLGKEKKEPQGFLSSSPQSSLGTEVLFIVTHMQILPAAGNFTT